MSKLGLAAAMLVVRIYDGYGVAAPNLVVARETASMILKGATVSVAWRDCTVATACRDELGSREVVVRLVAAPANALPQALGYSLIDLDQQVGSLSTILQDRLERLAYDTGADPGELLGRTIAHELGHLLLGTRSHSAGGLMRAHWDAREIGLNAPRDWVFSPDEATRIRRGLAGREKRVPIPTSVAATVKPCDVPKPRPSGLATVTGCGCEPPTHPGSAVPAVPAGAGAYPTCG